MTVLRYDGTWEGFLSAVFEAFRREHRDVTIARADAEPAGLFAAEDIPSNEKRALRVERGMRKLGRDAAETLYMAWLSELEGVDDAIAGYMRVGFAEKIDPAIHVLHPDVALVQKAARRVGWEAQRMRQFVRFVDVNGIFVADIEPLFDVLTLIAPHFHGRFNDQRLMIRDIRRRRALVSETAGWHIADLGEDPLPPLPRDGLYENLWRGYFKAIANLARKNPKLQRQFIPLRYRAHLTEFQGEGDARS